MSRVTSKLQVTIPKAIADRYGIAPGTDVEFVPAGDAIRVVPAAPARRPIDVAERLRLFDAATARIAAYMEDAPPAPSNDRGWHREELYARGRADRH